MNAKAAKAPAPLRCAIYTRKSTEEGLEQEFNSLDAQRESGEAYIKSQKHLGWECLPEHYDDGGFSGANMERPALQRLLADIEASKIDVVVVYKVDRLSRSLLDFARLIEAFDKRAISFVAVTQQFNTATSLGRLILNVLLSFAQFEREMIAERTRDKMGAARRKGKWLGGTAPLGYDVATSGPRRLVINPAEAEQIRAIFALYLKERSLLRVVETLNGRGWRTKAWTSKKGRRREGGLWGKWALRKILTSVTYIGQVEFKGEVFHGEHEAIIDPETFAQVGALLGEARRDVTNIRNVHGFLLRGLVRCAKCESTMVSTVTAPRGKAYRYYVCSEVAARGAKSCPVRHVSAPVLEKSVVDQIRAMGRDAALVRDTAEAVEESRRTETPALAAEKERLLRQLAASQAESKQLVSTLGDQAGAGNRVILERLGEVQQRIQQVEKRLPEIDAALAALGKKPVSPEAVANALSLFDPTWEGLVPREQASVLQMLLESVIYDGTTKGVELAIRPAGIAALAADIATVLPAHRAAANDGATEAP